MAKVEVKLLQYVFVFRDVKWREEFKIDVGPKDDDRLRAVLSRALTEVSGLKISSPEDAMRVLKAIPLTVIYRVFLIYKGSLPASRLFKTVGLYKAPEPSRMVRRIQEAEVERERIMDRVEQEMETKFGRQELLETRRIEQEMLRNSRGRGLTPASPEGLPPTAPPPANEVKIDPKTVEAAEKRPSKADPKNAVRKYV
jgi:hypothetical protein